MNNRKKLIWTILALLPFFAQAGEQEQLGAHAASCSAYFFSAANAKGVADYESLYGSGEYTVNLAVSAIGNDAALKQFNVSSENINRLMQKRWSDFYKVDEHYREQCAALNLAYLRVREENNEE